MDRLLQHPTLEWRYIDTKNGLIFPWLTQDCLEWLVKQPVENWRVFEYGAGYSTFWWCTAAKQAFSIDYDKNWAEKTRSMYTPNAKIYVMASIQGVNRSFFDCIIIDGHFRDECTEYALQAVRPGGYLIIDNYHQASADWPAEAWAITDILIEKYPKVIFHQQGHADWKTAVIQII